MKILITTDLYEPLINGVVVSVKNLISGLEKNGHDVKVLTLSYDYKNRKLGNVYYVRSHGIRVVYPGARIAFSKHSDYINELSRWKPDIIHSQCEFSTFRYAKAISKKTGAPIIHTYHTVYEGYTHYFCPSQIIGVKSVKCFTNEIAKHTDSIIVPSDKIYEMLKGYKVKTPLWVIPSGIDIDKYSLNKREKREELRKKVGINRDELVLLFVGRIAKEKNIDELILYLSKVKDLSMKLVIVGDGPYKQEIENMSKQMSVEERVIFTGMVNPEEVADYYALGDIFVNGSTSETQGLTYIEAMASGLALLCREDKCLDGLIDKGINGYTYKNEDEFLCVLYKLVKDKGMIERVGEAAFYTVRSKYSVEIFVDACERLYRKYVA